MEEPVDTVIPSADGEGCADLGGGGPAVGRVVPFLFFRKGAIGSSPATSSKGRRREEEGAVVEGAPAWATCGSGADGGGEGEVGRAGGIDGSACLPRSLVLAVATLPADALRLDCFLLVMMKDVERDWRTRT